MPAKPYLVMDAVEDRHWGETPQYKILLDWCRSENIEPEGCSRVEVYADYPQYALVTVYSLDEQNRRIVDETAESYVTHVVRVPLRTLPPPGPARRRGAGLMSRCMLRYQVVVNDRPQKIEMRGDWLAPARVEASTLGSGANAQHIVEFWSEGDLDGPTVAVWLQVFGTGHPLPEGARWWGTSTRTREGLVWHLYEVPAPEGQG